MGQKKHKKLRRTARLMADMKQGIEKLQNQAGKTPLIPSSQSHYRTNGQVRNNPLTERGTTRWLKRNAK